MKAFCNFMEDLFDLSHKGLERADVNLCIFLHLSEFLTIDLRWETPRVMALSASDILDNHFFSRVEEEFSRALREPGEHPFAKLMDLPLRLEEHVRETGMLAILEKLEGPVNGVETPTVAIFVIGGTSLEMTVQELAIASQALVGETADPDVTNECATLLKRLISEEQEVFKRINQQELMEALEDQSPRYFTLWERRN